MRDIRSDLEDRAQLLKEQIQAAQSAFKQQMETIEREHENKVDELRATLDAVSVLLGSENRRLKIPKAPDAETQVQEPELQQLPLQQANGKKKLTEFIVRELCDGGPASKDDLLKSAVREGYVVDDDSAERIFEKTLTRSKKAGSIRQLPNGNFALPTFAETIRLRRAG
jgi:hypothetical protein